jgi:CRISPR/Cas system-associated exonuclease Cas4 (RecB family)
MLRILDVGNDVHDRYHRYAKRAGILIGKEIRIGDKEYRIRGKLDQLVLINDKLRIIELKSMKSEKFIMLTGKPHESHYNQLQLYMWLMNKMFENGDKRKIFVLYRYLFPITEGSIVIENKNDQKVEEFSISYDKDRISLLLKKIKDMLRFIDENVMPPRIFDESSQECKWCDYRGICWNIGVADELIKLGEKYE